MKVRRMWVNQPSTLNPLHYLHGTNVLVVNGDKELTMFFLSGAVISQQVSESWLSEGWI